ncbi:MAG TPA: hypothetical protein VIJ87_06770 [Pyrinomonadaceae bacterium]
MLQNKWSQIAAVAVVAFAGGSAGGYILGKKRGSVTVVPPMEPGTKQLTIFDEEAQPDPVIEKDHSSELNTEHPPVIKYDEISVSAPETAAMIEDDRITVNVFTNDDGDWDHEVELSQRQSEVPYILHVDEFVENDFDFTQETVTYYAGDDIMVDSHDVPMYGHAGIMGDLRFGHGSKDPSIVYIRNEALQMEWEVILHSGMYSVEILGQEADQEIEEEIRHSNRRPLKFRET